MMNYLSLTEYAERIQRIFDPAGDAAGSKRIFVSNPAIGGIGNKISSSL
jgi:hypothetical protein